MKHLAACSKCIFVKINMVPLFGLSESQVCNVYSKHENHMTFSGSENVFSYILI